MIRTGKMKTYRDKLVRLARDLTTCGGTTYRTGRVFRVGTTWRGRLNLEAPTRGILFGENAPCIRQVHFREVELIPDPAPTTSFCRVCGCDDSSGCPLPGGGFCVWADRSHRICSRCVGLTCGGCLHGGHLHDGHGCFSPNGAFRPPAGARCRLRAALG